MSRRAHHQAIRSRRSSLAFPIAQRADLQQATLSFFAAVIDLHPHVALLEQSEVGKSGQCFGCNLGDFLSSVDCLGDYVGLVEAQRLLSDGPELLHALSLDREDKLVRVLAKIKATSCREITTPGASRRFPSLPQLLVVRDDLTAPSHRELEGLAKESTVLVTPSEGTRWIVEQARTVSGSPGRQLLLGFVDHAHATEHWADFCDGEDFVERWQLLVNDLRQLDFASVGLALPFPPCAMLQFKQNIGLEQVRAQMDVSFRRMAGDRSLMCQENVSGYTLIDDVRRIFEHTSFGASRIWFRLENLMLELRNG